MAQLGVDVFTVGQVARMIAVANRTVAKWCDGGYLPHHRIPGSQDRRITRESLIEFLRANGLPLPHRINEGGRVLMVGCNGYGARLRAALPEGCTLTEAADPWEGATCYSPGTTRAVVLDASELGMETVRSIARRLKQERDRPRVVVLLPEDGGLSLDGTDDGVTDVVRHPADPAAVVRLVLSDRPARNVPVHPFRKGGKLVAVSE